ncbi:hypothetical protein MA16_Dca009981 [Dendrobium catenatum]|uniref:Uncharacterized protein n=1 Tax=Dendrobium catenatum TaxID=906689 RepID=A0A2I0VIZ7_9ASPA|nr:hypothetical protein MA16_Dca009981 [Dendrobium catenatum]
MTAELRKMTDKLVMTVFDAGWDFEFRTTNLCLTKDELWMIMDLRMTDAMTRDGTRNDRSDDGLDSGARRAARLEDESSSSSDFELDSSSSSGFDSRARLEHPLARARLDSFAPLNNSKILSYNKNI